jgi:hypothetical protein
VAVRPPNYSTTDAPTCCFKDQNPTGSSNLLVVC